MKIDYDNQGRKIYKFSSSVVQGGYLYAHKTADGETIKNKEGLKNALKAVVNKYKLIDPTVKVYDSIFFFFFLNRNTKPLELIERIQRNGFNFAVWDKDYLYTTVYDLQEKFIRKDLEKWGFDYGKG